MKTRICILAALLAVAGTAWADKSAYFSARYGGWSKEPSCEEDYNTKVKTCWTLTIGKDNLSNERADLSYACTSQHREWQSISYWTTFVVDIDRALEASWDGRGKERLQAEVSVDRQQRKPVYYHHIQGTGAFVERMSRHEVLYVWLPGQRGQRLTRARFPMARAISSIKQTVDLCGITHSQVSDALNR